MACDDSQNIQFSNEEHAEPMVTIVFKKGDWVPEKYKAAMIV